LILSTERSRVVKVLNAAIPFTLVVSHRTRIRGITVGGKNRVTLDHLFVRDGPVGLEPLNPFSGSSLNILVTEEAGMLQELLVSL
jgi:hypothetical protein